MDAGHKSAWTWMLLTVACAAAAAPISKRVQASNQASARLLRDLTGVFASDSYKRGVFEVELDNDNIYEWNVKLNIMDDKLALAKDLKWLKANKRDAEDHIMLRISYGPDYPVAPPFVRIVYPVLRGPWMHRAGAICMDLITKSGWLSEYTSEALILATLQHIIEGQSRVDAAPDLSELHTDENARNRLRELERFHNWDNEGVQKPPTQMQLAGKILGHWAKSGIKWLVWLYS